MTPTPRKRILRFTHTLLAVASVGLIGLSTSCQPSTTAPCGGCPADETCNTQTDRCEPTGLPRYTDPAPAHGLEVVSRADTIWLAAVDRTSGRLVAGSAGPNTNADTASLRSLANVPVTSEAGLDVTVTSDRSASGDPAPPNAEPLFAVGWLTTDQSYRIALHDGRQWRRSPPISTDGDAYTGSEDMALAADENGRLYLAFRDRQRDGLYLLSEPPPDDAAAPPTDRVLQPDQWRLTMVDDGTRSPQSCQSSDAPPPGIGVNPNMLVAEGRLNVVYHDPTCGDLRHAYRSTATQSASSSAWSIELIDTEDRQFDDNEAGGFGRFSDITTNPDGQLAIAYSDSLRGRLLFAVRRGQFFETTTVDRGSRLGAFSQQRKHLVGAFVDLEFTSDGTALIAYLDATDNRARLARRPAGQTDWSHQSIDLPRPSGFYNGLVRAQGAWQLLTEHKRPGPQGLSSRLQHTNVEARP